MGHRQRDVGITDLPSTYAPPRCPTCGSRDRRPLVTLSASARRRSWAARPGDATEQRQRAIVRLLAEAWPYNVEAPDIVAAIEGSPCEIGGCLRRLREIGVLVKEPQQWPRWRSRWTLTRPAAQALWLTGTIGGKNPLHQPVYDVLDIR